MMIHFHLLVDDCETFRMSDNCLGVVWHDDAGWHGNLHWDVEGDTDFVGPFTTVMLARQSVRAAFVSAAQPADSDRRDEQMG